MSERPRTEDLIAALAAAADERSAEIRSITGNIRLLALNARIEAAVAGDAGRGFGVVADEMKEMSNAIEALAKRLQSDIAGTANELARSTRVAEDEARGRRLCDLALNLIEILDRNLYERSCDVRWWATDAAVVDCCADPGERSAGHAAERLAVILRAYTVYADIWLLGPDGRVLACGAGTAGRERRLDPIGWVRQALNAASGDDFVAAGVVRAPWDQQRLVAPYATAVRAGGAVHGAPVGAIVVWFDWDKQSRAIVDGIGLSPEERNRTRACIVDGDGLVLAASDGAGVLAERIHAGLATAPRGHLRRDGMIIAHCLTPGYETYRGLGWHGVLIQRD